VILRTRQIACLLVLLSTLGLGAAASAKVRGFRGTPIEALLYRQSVTNQATEPVAMRPGDDAKASHLRGISASARVTITAAWPVPAAAQQASAINALQAAPRSL
jgi:hypothetical protein